MLLCPEGMDSLSGRRGTTLVEAVIAIGILAGAVVALSALASVATRSAMLARERSTSTMLAFQKMEAVRGDTTVPSVSPSDAWAIDTAGYLEYLDAYGRPAGGRSGAAYVRRWSVTPLPSAGSLLAIQVVVAPCRVPSGAAQCGDSAASVRLASIRTRAAW